MFRIISSIDIFYREGNDGPWSTFSLRVGSNSTKSQVVRLMASTALPTTWVVWSPACNTTQCVDNRGGVFNQNYSSTWREKGTYDLWFEKNLNYTGNGLYGFDTIGLGRDASEGQTLDGQVVATFFEQSFHFGFFGLNPQPTNFTDFRDPIPSFMQTLKDLARIPSKSYGYTAGNQYRKSCYYILTETGFDVF